MKLNGNEVIGIDAGTQGISVILWNPQSRCLIAAAEAPYARDHLPGLPAGRLEQSAVDWALALKQAMALLRAKLSVPLDTVAGIGVTGHMHCMVRRDVQGNKPWGCDMWNDPRGGPESLELSDAFGEHIPARWTASHILAAMREASGSWHKVRGVTVTSGSLVHDLTGEWVLGPGDASGMFGNLGEDGQIDRRKLAILDQLSGQGLLPLADVVPRVVKAGEVAGRLHAAGAALLGGLPIGTPVAAPEGDQQSALIGAGAGELELALSAGTSFTGNLPCAAHVVAQSERMNVLSTPDGRSMLMVCARNGTLGFAQHVRALATWAGRGFEETADRLTDLAQDVPVAAYGANLLGFFQGENVTETPNARAHLFGAGLEILSNPGLLARLLLESPCMVMRYGLEQMEQLAGRVRRVRLSGGVLKSKGGYAPQLFADILGLPVAARVGDEEGTAKGAAILAAYMVARQKGRVADLDGFVAEAAAGTETEWVPDPSRQGGFTRRYEEFCHALERMRAETK